MTEAEWLACEAPERILNYLGASGTRRKWRLAVCSICRTAWHLLSDERSRVALETAELAADDQAIRRERMRSAFNEAAHASNAVDGTGVAQAEAAHAVMSVQYASTGSLSSGHLWDVFKHVARATGESDSHPRQTAILRDIFGNPFRPVTFSPEWQTPAAVALAKGMYESRDFSAMPILADALQDAGCDNDDILNHCRGDGPHVRGCWVVDLVLGKS